jgi:hypothetical protein
MNRALRTLAIVIPLLLLLPPAGILLQGEAAAPYFHFPPRTSVPAEPEFSWPAFVLMALFILAACTPFLLHVLTFRGSMPPKKSKHPFPWWGWLGLALMLLFWPLAWGRFSWFASFQSYTFPPLWLGFILAVNGLCYRRRGGCLPTDEPRFFLALFPASALFWWFFEYLNRFVQNWHYGEIDNLSAVRYALEATLSFSTVLPAVLSTTGLLATFPRLTRPLAEFLPLALPRPRLAAWLLLVAAGCGLAGLGIWPTYLYPLLWFAPLLLIAAVQVVGGEETILAPLRGGDWRPVWLPALAALICGFFWEIWNWRSLASWEYSVPLVERFHLFEMPLLGYAGYLPFGVECLVAADLLRRLLGKKDIRTIIGL